MMSNWVDVPDDLLYLLSQRLLGLSTFLRFGAVCRYWHSFTLANKCYKPVPWLMLSEKEGTDIRQFFDISTSEVYEFPLPQARGRKIVGSAHGWVMTVGEDFQIHLLNPLDGAQIQLPPIQASPDVPHFWFRNPRKFRNFFLKKATWSANPAACNGDFLVMAMHLISHTPCLSFCRPSDKKWTSFETICPNEVAFAGGQFYAVADGRILSCDISNKSAPQHAEVASSIYNWRIWGSYIVDCGGELLFVVKCRDFDHPDDEPDYGDELEDMATIFHTYGFLVYKLDLVGKKLTKVRDIGDYALFVGYNNSFSLPITSYIDNKHFKRNCIYFTDDDSDALTPSIEVEGGEDMGVFCLDDSLDIYNIQPSYPYASKSSFSLPIWFVPDPSQRDHPGNANRS